MPVYGYNPVVQHNEHMFLVHDKKRLPVKEENRLPAQEDSLPIEQKDPPTVQKENIVLLTTTCSGSASDQSMGPKT